MRAVHIALVALAALALATLVRSLRKASCAEGLELSEVAPTGGGVRLPHTNRSRAYEEPDWIEIHNTSSASVSLAADRERSTVVRAIALGPSGPSEVATQSYFVSLGCAESERELGPPFVGTFQALVEPGVSGVHEQAHEAPPRCRQTERPS